MRKLTLNTAALILVLALMSSVITVLPATGRDEGIVIDRLNELHDRLEGEKPALHCKVKAVINQIEAGAFEGAVDKLENDVKKSIMAWIEDHEELIELVDKLIDLIKRIRPCHPRRPDFEISTPPYQLDVVQGAFNTTTVTIASQNRFNRVVHLKATTTATGVTITLKPDSVTPPKCGSVDSILRVEAAQGAIPGNYEITVTGTSYWVEHDITIALRIIEAPSPPPTQDFAIAASPKILAIQQGKSNVSVISVSSINGFHKQVNLTITSTSIPGVGTALNPDKVIPPPGSYAISILTVDVADSAAAGTVIITVTGESALLHHDINVTLNINEPPVPPAPDFNINAYPVTLVIEQGDTASSTIVVTSLRGFSESVELTFEPETISGVTLSLDPIQLTLSPTNFNTSTLKIEVAMGTLPHELEITVTGTSGSLQHSAGISLKVIIEKNPPKILSVSRTPPATPAYNETVTVFANVVDLESGIKDVTLEYSKDAVQESLAMTLSAGLYQAAISAFPFGTTVEYWIQASDNVGNSAESDSITYIVADPYQPLMGVPTWSPRDPVVNDDIVVNVTVAEPEGASGVDEVTLRYSNTTAVFSISMTDNHDGNWSAVISNQTGPKVTFVVEALDKAGNKIESDTLEIDVTTPAFPLVWILAAIVILAAATGGGAYYVRRRRKKGATATSVPSAAVKPILLR